MNDNNDNLHVVNVEEEKMENNLRGVNEMASKSFRDKLYPLIKLREEDIQHKTEYHYRTTKKLKRIYYIFGIQTTVYSSIVSFLSGINVYSSFDFFTVAILIFALVSTILNAVMTFSNIVEKLANHRDAYNKYETIRNTIDRFKLKKINETTAMQFVEIVDSELNYINEYADISCCFEYIHQKPSQKI